MLRKQKIAQRQYIDKDLYYKNTSPFSESLSEAIVKADSFEEKSRLQSIRDRHFPERAPSNFDVIETKKGGIERVFDRIAELSETKKDFSKKIMNITEKLSKVLEACKKYGKSIKA